MISFSLKRLKGLIEGGENTTVDFKANLFDYSDGKAKTMHHRELVKDLSAFANTEGGCLLVGVGDDGFITGFQSNDLLEQKIINLCRDLVNPPLRPTLHKLKVEDKELLVIEMQKGFSDLHMVRGRIYIRVHNEVRAASSSELTDIILQRNHHRMRELLQETDNLSNLILQVSHLSSEMFKTRNLLSEAEYHSFFQGQIDPKNIGGIDVTKLLNKSEQLLTNLEAVEITDLPIYLQELDHHTQRLENANVELETALDLCYSSDV